MFRVPFRRGAVVAQVVCGLIIYVDVGPPPEGSQATCNGISTSTEEATDNQGTIQLALGLGS